ncbi:MAG TPA: glycoside hydrolase family 16 protein, partial [Acidimicrobiales bacterium]|nr:glycoside hydrolase family 16 protein [Acidimicrobiales bacterium]
AAGAAPARESTSAWPLGGASHPPPSGWNRVLNEDFDVPLRSWRWNRCHWWNDGGCTIASNHELQWYLPGNVWVSNGRLVMEARRQDVTTPTGARYDYSSGMVTTGPPQYRTAAKFAFTYGYAEARIRIPAGRGLWPAFWLLPADQQSRPEIDVVEVLGHDTRTSRFHYHYVDRSGVRRSLGHRWTGPELAGTWHRFAIDWRPGEITFIVDGQARWRVRGNEVSNEPMYLVFNLAVGGDYPGPPDSSTRFPARFEVDWVRVWQAPR